MGKIKTLVNLWADFKFPPLNLFNMPKHQVLIDAHSKSLNPLFWENDSTQFEDAENMPDKKSLSDITVFSKYARFLPHKNRRENWVELVTRNMEMHQRQYPKFAEDIENIYRNFVFPKKVLPSMRSLQFGGRPIELNHARMFNCSFMLADNYHFFSELMFLLLSGCGVGYSVQPIHVEQLPEVQKPRSIGESKYQIQDSIVGWSDSIKTTIKAFLLGRSLPTFDFRDIRDKGEALITSGGKAPGSEPLKICLSKVTEILMSVVGRKLKPIEVHDIACIIADSVLAGGIRRSAMICLFDRNDTEMLNSKSGEWYLTAPYRARANNSVVLPRGEVTEPEFRKLMQIVENSGCGEPGVYWTNDINWGSNPCCEIALEPNGFCNLTTINAGAVHSQEDFNKAARAAAFIGTLQAGYTDFHYIRNSWKEVAECTGLLGVSITGIASGNLDNLNVQLAANHAVQSNEFWAAKLGINPAERVTTIKPEGTASLVVGTSSGIHAWHSKYYIRRMRLGKNEALAQYLSSVVPELVEEDKTNSNQVVVSFPQKAPENAITRDEPMIEMLERINRISTEWVKSGHVKGKNTHNVSATVSVKEDEWELLTQWMWINRDVYNGISVLPYFGALAYPQLPFEDCDEETYLKMLPHLQKIDISRVIELNDDGVNLQAELACAGGACEVAAL